MSYSIQAANSKKLTISFNAQSGIFMLVAIVLGALVFVYGFYRLQATEFLDSSLLLMAFGLCLAAGSAIVRNQQERLPRGFELDNEKGRLRFIDSNASTIELGYADFTATGLHYSGRKQYQINLQRSNGSRIGLLTASFRKRAAELAARINTHLATARRRSQHAPRLPQKIQEVRVGDTRRLLWQDRENWSIYLLIGLLVCGLALGGLVLMREVGLEAAWHPAILVLPAVYLLLTGLQLWRDYSSWHALEIDARALRIGRVSSKRGLSRQDNVRQSLQGVRNFPRNEIVEIIYNFDLNVSIPIFWLLDADQWQNYKSDLKQKKNSDKTPADSKKVEKKRRSVLLKARRMRLPGLSCTAALAVEAFIRKELRLN